MHFLKGRITPQKCYDYEQSIRSTTLLALTITSFFSAFLSLALALIGTFGFLILEKCKFNKEQVLDNEEQTTTETVKKTSISYNNTIDDFFQTEQVVDDSEGITEKQEAIEKFKISWHIFMEEWKSCEFGQVLLDQIETLNTQLGEIHGSNFFIPEMVRLAEKPLLISKVEAPHGEHSI